MKNSIVITLLIISSLNTACVSGAVRVYRKTTGNTKDAQNKKAWEYYQKNEKNLPADQKGDGIPLIYEGLELSAEGNHIPTHG